MLDYLSHRKQDGPMESAAKRKRPGTGLWLWLKAFFVWFLARVLLFTVRLRVRGEKNLHEARQADRPLLFAFWHGRQLGLFKANPEESLAVMTSLSRDGQMQSMICERFGLQVVRGSSSRSGLAGLLAMGKKLKQGVSVAVAVDGPRGPAFETKPGIVALAKVSACPIVPISIGYRRSWEFERAWDRFQVPKPFTLATVVYAKPLFVPASSTRQQLASLTEELNSRLRLITEEADRSTIGGQSV